MSFKIGFNELASARHLFENMIPLPVEVVCYLSQQSVEKSLKAILYKQEKQVPSHHRILDLLDIVNKENQVISLSDKDAIRLTRFATRTRYADNKINISETDAEYALKKATDVMSQTAKELGIDIELEPDPTKPPISEPINDNNANKPTQPPEPPITTTQNPSNHQGENLDGFFNAVTTAESEVNMNPNMAMQSAMQILAEILKAVQEVKAKQEAEQAVQTQKGSIRTVEDANKRLQELSESGNASQELSDLMQTCKDCERLLKLQLVDMQEGRPLNSNLEVQLGYLTEKMSKQYERLEQTVNTSGNTSFALNETQSNPIIVTFSGKAGHGKDTGVTLLKETLEEKGLKVLEISYADALKEYVRDNHGWNGEKDEAGRSLLQNVGLEKREENPDYWIDKVMDKALNDPNNKYDVVLIRDARFPNEISAWADKGCDVTALHINRPDYVNPAMTPAHFIKKTNKTPSREIEQAKRNMTDHKERKE